MSMQTQNESVVDVDTSSKIHIEEPKRYYVVMHNDDSTPIDFVIKILIDLYHHEEKTASD